jgi:DNA invertase Pin-like site-specific DNA recombinase
VEIVQARDWLVDRAVVVMPLVEVNCGRIDGGVLEHHAQCLAWPIAEHLGCDHEYFVRLIGAIEAGELDVVIARDIDRLTRNLTDWNRFKKACVRHGVLLSPYTGGDLDLSTPEGAYYGGMETLRAKRESTVKSAGCGRRWIAARRRRLT